MGPQGPIKENAQLTRQNDISFKLFTLVYCLARESLKCNSLVQKICMFLQKETSHLQNSFALGPQGPKDYIFGDHFYSKNPRKFKFYVFLLFYATKHMMLSFYLKWTEFTRNCEFFFSICGSPETRTKLEQIHNFLRIRYTSGKMVISYVFWH